MTRLTEEARGVYVIAVTPFAEDGALDLQSIDKMVDFYLEAGATGLTALGMMGEAPKLTGAESLQVVKRILARLGGRIPMVVGVSAPGFAQMAELTRASMDLGAGGVMIAPPGSSRPTSKSSIIIGRRQSSSATYLSCFRISRLRPAFTFPFRQLPGLWKRCRPASA